MCHLKLTYVLLKLNSNHNNYLERRPTKGFFFREGIIYQWHCSELPAHVDNKKQTKF